MSLADLVTITNNLVRLGEILEKAGMKFTGDPINVAEVIKILLEPPKEP